MTTASYLTPKTKSLRRHRSLSRRPDSASETEYTDESDSTDTAALRHKSSRRDRRKERMSDVKYALSRPPDNRRGWKRYRELDDDGNKVVIWENKRLNLRKTATVKQATDRPRGKSRRRSRRSSTYKVKRRSRHVHHYEDDDDSGYGTDTRLVQRVVRFPSVQPKSSTSIRVDGNVNVYNGADPTASRRSSSRHRERRSHRSSRDGGIDERMVTRRKIVTQRNVEPLRGVALLWAKMKGDDDPYESKLVSDTSKWWYEMLDFGKKKGIRGSGHGPAPSRPVRRLHKTGDYSDLRIRS